MQFKSFHELMTRRVSEILLISSTYDAFIMQEDGPLAERIIHEYRGLNLSRPPRLTWISTIDEALEKVATGEYDLVIIMPHIGDMDAYDLCKKIRKLQPHLPLYYFAYDAGQLLKEKNNPISSVFDQILIWSGDTDLLLAVVKNQEDKMNVDLDTQLANVRVIIFVEDSPLFLSCLLPVLYREIVLQTQSVMDDSLNEKDRLLRMRTRPKIVVARNYEQAWQLYEKYKNYLFCIISDVRFQRKGVEDSLAGIRLLKKIKQERPNLPLLLLSSETENREKACQIPALFSDKNSPNLHTEISHFFTHSLGFGAFHFRLENGEVIEKARSLRKISTILQNVPSESIAYHARRNDFSRWFMARFEMDIAQQIRSVTLEDFSSIEALRNYLITVIRDNLRRRQKGLVSDFIHTDYDPENDFVKIGRGSLGGKARGLAFISSLLQENAEFATQFDSTSISLPKTMVITTEGFDLFVKHNNIQELLTGQENDIEIEALFKRMEFPAELRVNLETFLKHTDYPIAVRSSAILEDAHYRASAGAYTTYMLPNSHPSSAVRLEQLIDAIKLVYSSVFQETPKILAKNSVFRQEEDKMAVIVQQLVGSQFGEHYYPAISGVAQSYNYYPVGHMKPKDGVAHIALGLGKIVVDGRVALRFCPKYPQLLPQFSNTKDILNNCQNFFYGLRMATDASAPITTMVEKIEVDEARNHFPIQKLSSTYVPEESRLRDYFSGEGHPIVTFASVLKYREFPLGNILSSLLELGEKGMGCPVEIEFAVRFDENERSHFYILQIRPMIVAHDKTEVKITNIERKNAWCFSEMCMGNSQETPVENVVYVKPASFDTAKTREVAAEVSLLNHHLKKLGKKYMLIGPGRWGSSDRWLGIPVRWSAITEAETIIETTTDKLHADPSQGSHFFHNIASLGINYLSVPPKGNSFLNMDWLEKQPVIREMNYLKYVELSHPSLLKIDGKLSQAVLLEDSTLRTISKIENQLLNA